MHLRPGTALIRIVSPGAYPALSSLCPGVGQAEKSFAPPVPVQPAACTGTALISVAAAPAIASAAMVLMVFFIAFSPWRVDDDVVPVAVDGLVEAAAAGDQAQLGNVGVAVDGLGGEAGLGDLLGLAHAELGCGAVLSGHLDLVTRGELLEPVEDAGLLVAVDMAQDHGRAGFTGRAGVAVPTGLHGLLHRRHLDGLVGVEAR